MDSMHVSLLSLTWPGIEFCWKAFGFLAQAMFFGRFFIQWIASERQKRSVVPVAFWWLSLLGGGMLFTYAIHIRDPVFILGQGLGLGIYVRNLYFVYRMPAPAEAAGKIKET